MPPAYVVLFPWLLLSSQSFLLTPPRAAPFKNLGDLAISTVSIPPLFPFRPHPPKPTMGLGAGGGGGGRKKGGKKGVLRKKVPRRRGEGGGQEPLSQLGRLEVTRLWWEKRQGRKEKEKEEGEGCGKMPPFLTVALRTISPTKSLLFFSLFSQIHFA